MLGGTSRHYKQLSAAMVPPAPNDLRWALNSPENDKNDHNDQNQAKAAAAIISGPVKWPAAKAAEAA
jgi:hypothetical protein